MIANVMAANVFNVVVVGRNNRLQSKSHTMYKCEKVLFGMCLLELNKIA